MAVPTHRVNGAITNVSTAAVAPTIPATAEAGDILLAVHANETENNTITVTPTGWTLVDLSTYATANNDFTLGVWRAECTSGGSNDPGTSPSWTWGTADRATARIAAFQGVDTTTPVHGTPVKTSAASVTSLDVGPYTTTIAETLVVGIITADLSAGQGTTWTLPGGVATVWNETGLAGSDAPAGNVVQAVFTENAATSGTYGAYTCTNTQADHYGGIVFALAPGATATRDLEGYRWRNDDGSETAATWAAAQDTGITAATGTPRRLRTIINATGDPASTQYRLQYRRQGDPATEWEDVV